jgi:hypothetical protein
MATNRFFSNGIDILPLSKARSAQVEANFTAVEDGFTLAQAEIDAKLGLAGGTMTGDLAMGGKKVSGLPTPVAADEAVPLGHVTALFGSTSSAAASAVTATAQAGIATTKAGEASASADAAALSAASIAGGPVASVNGMTGIVTGIATAADITAERSAVAILTNKTVTGLKETKAAVAANNIDLATGNCFSKTAAGVATWTVTNVPAAGTFASFVLDLTNGGSAAQTWWASVKWAGGTPPALTAAGRDSLGFYTHDGGVTWTGLVLGRDIK